ncbi:hypothetical protein AXG93_2442s1000 [Marchantia polymorpha subsp. ruderalis]|uniref:Uncharacterized protein n=1 Tax=Marchantia polymorpha subsp. ruderalis TaxID=1480154 RepID=A0A176VBM5_MARPO|nr:hypothetical protein AXG93_2442s1000 [Marchantia polymorpha subsp. ruderalis]
MATVNRPLLRLELAVSSAPVRVENVPYFRKESMEEKAQIAVAEYTKTELDNLISQMEAISQAAHKSAHNTKKTDSEHCENSRTGLVRARRPASENEEAGEPSSRQKSDKISDAMGNGEGKHRNSERLSTTGKTSSSSTSSVCGLGLLHQVPTTYFLWYASTQTYREGTPDFCTCKSGPPSLGSGEIDQLPPHEDRDTAA